MSSPYGTGNTNVREYLKTVSYDPNVEWYERKGLFWGGAYINNNEEEYTWFEPNGWDNYPVARYILAPHQDFDELGVDPAFIELKLVFDKCAQNTFKCTIRSHKLTPATISTEWDSETVKTHYINKFFNQGGHSWYKNGVSVRKYGIDGLETVNDVYFAPYNSPFILRITADSSTLQQQSCKSSNELGCDQLSFDGWHDDHNRGCVYYRDSGDALCNTKGATPGDSVACTNDLADCKNCITKTGTAFTLFDICQQCTSTSTHHAELKFTIKVDETPAQNLLTVTDSPPLLASTYVCEGAFAYGLQGIKGSTTIIREDTGEHIRIFLHSSNVRYDVEVDPASKTISNYKYLNGKSVAFQCYNYGIPSFTNQCPHFLSRSQFSCSDSLCNSLAQESRYCQPESSIKQNCVTFYNNPNVHCAACGAPDRMTKRIMMKYSASILPVSALNRPTYAEAEDDVHVAEALTASSGMLFSDVVQLDTNEEIITFIPQGIPYALSYEYTGGCALHVCDEFPVPQSELNEIEIQPLGKDTCEMTTVRVDLNTIINDRLHWTREDVKFNPEKLELIYKTNAEMVYWLDLDEALDQCDALGPAVCYAVGRHTNGAYRLYRTLNSAFPFYDETADVDFEIYIRKLDIGRGMFDKLCFYHPTIHTLIISHLSLLPMEAVLSDTGAFRECTSIRSLEFRNIVVADAVTFQNLYLSLLNLGISSFSLVFDREVVDNLNKPNFFYACAQTNPIKFTCTVNAIPDATTPKWSTTKTYTRRRDRMSDNDDDQRKNRTIVIVIAGVAAFLVVCVGGILIVKRRHQQRDSEEKYPLTPM